MSRYRRRSAPRSLSVGTPWLRGVAAAGAVAVAMTATMGQRYPGPAGAGNGSPGARTAAHVQRVIPPDVAVIEPSGLGAALLAKIAKIPHVKQLLAVDGASIIVGGRKANVIGVDAGQFRAWTPLSTSTRQKLWATLAAGGFIASPSLAHKLALHTGARYQLGGAGTVTAPFAGAASLNLAGIDLVVSDRDSAQLGLIHDVAALISAPSVAIGKLQREVRAALPGTATVVSLRQQLPLDRGTGGRPGNYLDLFRTSAARYCPGLSWTVLAAIGQIESGDGANNGPSPAGALGPMQFMPATWARWGITAFGETGPPNIMDPYDAVPSAARYLCAAGASTPAGLPGAIFAYNHADWYVAEVLALAREYAKAYG